MIYILSDCRLHRDTEWVSHINKEILRRLTYIKQLIGAVKNAWWDTWDLHEIKPPTSPKHDTGNTC